MRMKIHFIHLMLVSLSIPIIDGQTVVDNYLYSFHIHILLDLYTLYSHHNNNNNNNNNNSSSSNKAIVATIMVIMLWKGLPFLVVTPLRIRIDMVLRALLALIVILIVILVILIVILVILIVILVILVILVMLVLIDLDRQRWTGRE